jgi:hypothetical protein
LETGSRFDAVSFDQKDAGDIASHTARSQDFIAGWRKSAAVKRNSFAQQAFLDRCQSLLR